MNAQNIRAAIIAAVIGCVMAGPAASQPPETSETAAILRQMQIELQQLRHEMAERDRRIEQLQRQVESLQGMQEDPRVDRREALKEHEHQPARPHAPEHVDAVHAHDEHHEHHEQDEHTDALGFRLIDVSMEVLVAAGGSTASNDELATLQGGGHDPRRRGFTFQNAELSLLGAVDPYFDAEAHIIFFVDPIEGETIVELEEAFLTTQSLPWGLEARVGQFFTPFGLINARHPHEWSWLDLPVINARVFGPDGMRGVGAQIDWLTPLPWDSHVIAGVQNAEGETMASFHANDEFFEERAIGGRPFNDRDVHSLADLMYFARWANHFQLSDAWTLGLGGSVAWGPNATGPDADTLIYGGDVALRWRPAGHWRGWPFVTWQTEYTRRHYDAAAALHPGMDADNAGDDVLLPGDTLEDWGVHTQLLYGFVRDWAAGVRYEYATGSGDSVDDSGAFVSHDADPFRGERHRVSPLLMWRPTEFSRIRLQYNYDHADYLEDGEAHSVWLGFEVLFGAHGEHAE